MRSRRGDGFGKLGGASDPLELITAQSFLKLGEFILFFMSGVVQDGITKSSQLAGNLLVTEVKLLHPPHFPDFAAGTTGSHLGMAPSPPTSAAPMASAAEIPVAGTVMLRPVSNPLPLGFAALFVGTLILSGLQLRWVPAAQQHHIAVALLAFVVPMQLLACVFGFAVRDVAASTGMGLLSATWAAIGVEQLTSPPRQASAGLGLLLIVAASALLVPVAGAAVGKIAPATVLALAAVRFVTTGVYEMTASVPWRITAGIVGCVLAVAAFYTALAAELEGALHRPVLPQARIRRSRWLSQGSLGRQLADIEKEPGVRQQL